MTREKTGRIIGATFGLAFVQVNAAALPTAAAVPLRALALIAFLAVLRGVRRSPAPLPAAREGAGAPSYFGRRYGYVVGAEVIAGAAGILVLNGPLDAPDAVVAWIAFVVGVHFFGLAAVWRMPALNRLAAAMSACGAAGLVLCALGSPRAAVAVVAGILPGALLLGSVLWSVHREAAAAAGAAGTAEAAGAAEAPAAASGSAP
ncbi:hypothetical protein [Streptomyces sp. NPDC086989]|uniref:hypothetical protein n=1 Tax=Streptomyces sp. NPDC086989 TaxID=3365764 RepID=UPI00381EEC10